MTDTAGRCATCRHAEILGPKPWADAEGQALRSRYPLACKRAEMDDGKPDDPQTMAFSMAFSMDGSSYRASLMVTPDFGCVMYEPKE